MAGAGGENSRVELLKRSLLQFYHGKDLFATVISPITSQRTDVSLRLIDHLVTSYAKENDTAYAIDGRAVSIYREYRSRLRAYTKRYFDPFCRRDRITVTDGSTTLVTTVGQLNFFRFVIDCGLLQYCIEHREAIESSMASAHRRPKTVAPAYTVCSSFKGDVKLSLASPPAGSGAGSGAPSAASAGVLPA